MELEILKQWVTWMCKWAVFLFIIFILIQLLPIGRDDSDGEWPNRSGLNIRTDALTGCQYLEAQSGGITPRIDNKGKHIGCHFS